MKRIVEIVPARPGWYARWQLAPDATRCYPVTLWALVEDTDAATREVIGVDAVGQWPGEEDPSTGEFVRYLFQTPESGQPADADPESGPSPTAAAQPQPHLEKPTAAR